VSAGKTIKRHGRSNSWRDCETQWQRSKLCLLLTPTYSSSSSSYRSAGLDLHVIPHTTRYSSAHRSLFHLDGYYRFEAIWYDMIRYLPVPIWAIRHAAIRNAPLISCGGTLCTWILSLRGCTYENSCFYFCLIRISIDLVSENTMTRNYLTPHHTNRKNIDSFSDQLLLEVPLLFVCYLLKIIAFLIEQFII
jgi:hypothetical protein